MIRSMLYRVYSVQIYKTPMTSIYLLMHSHYTGVCTSSDARRTAIAHRFIPAFHGCSNRPLFTALETSYPSFQCRNTQTWMSVYRGL